MLAMCQVPLLLAENSESFVHLTRHSAEEPTYLMLYPCKTRNSPDVMGFRLSGVRSKLGSQTRLAAIRDIPILYRAWPRARSRTGVVVAAVALHHSKRELSHLIPCCAVGPQTRQKSHPGSSTTARADSGHCQSSDTGVTGTLFPATNNNLARR